MASFRLLFVISLIFFGVSAQAADCVGRFGRYDLELHSGRGKVGLLWFIPGNTRPSYRADFVSFKGTDRSQKYVIFRSDAILEKTSGSSPGDNAHFEAISLETKAGSTILYSSSAVALTNYLGTSYVTLEDNRNKTILRCKTL